jgi:hypothetical protein
VIAGDGLPGDLGDGGPAVEARLSSPSGLAVSGSLLYVLDRGNQRVRVIDLVSGAMRATAAPGVAEPTAIAVHRGGLVVADRKTGTVAKAGATGGNAPPKGQTFAWPARPGKPGPIALAVLAGRPVGRRRWGAPLGSDPWPARTLARRRWECRTAVCALS